jgi:hypothetical protein
VRFSGHKLSLLGLAACVLLLPGISLLAVTVGETLDQVYAEKGLPKSQLEAGTRRILTYPDTVIKLDNDVVMSFRNVAVPKPTPAPPKAAAPAKAQDNPQNATDLAEVQRNLKTALARVRAIVNQPVDSVALTPEIKAKAGSFNEGWFHPGALVPAFMSVDIETTQELGSYSQEEWVTSSLTPDRAFHAADLEFNSMTKFFYMDRTLPKKRLTTQEMVEINLLYRKIGGYASDLQRMGHPWTPTPGDDP